MDNRLGSPETSNQVKELPGFYFDVKKKRYFRIPPNSESHLFAKLLPSNANIKNRSNIQTIKPFSIARLLYYQELGNLQSYQRHLKDQLILSLNCQKCQNLDSFDQLDEVSCLVGCQKRSSLLGIWHLENETNIFNIMSVDIKWEQGQTALCPPCFKPSCSDMYYMHDQVSHLCWANVDQDITCVLYAVTPSNSFSSYARLRPLPNYCKFSDSYNLQPYKHEFILGNQAVWTCAWNKYQHWCSFGVENHALLMNLHENSTKLFTKKSSPLSQVFSQNGQLLYHGTKHGDVICSDLRFHKMAYSWSMGPTVCCIKLLKNEYQMIISAFKGQLQQWDLRMKRSIHQYRGHYNDYVKLSFSLNEEDGILCAAGQDGFTRIWNLFDSDLVREIPPPHPVSRQTIPIAVYGNCWGGRFSRPALIIAVKGEMFIYELPS